MRGLFVLGVFLILIIPFAFSQECGDLICDSGENVSCLSDCVGDDFEEIAPSPNDSAIEEELAALEKSNDSPGLIIKVIIFISVLFILGIVCFIIYIRMRKGSEVSEQGESAEKVFVQPQSDVVVSGQGLE